MKSKIFNNKYADLLPAEIEWNSQGTPVASLFNDIYFSNQNGLHEAYYVFLDGNQLPQRWINCRRSQFIIAETGFGIGLNFMVTCQAFAHFRRTYPAAALKTLLFVSVEKHPLRLTDLISCHEQWPELSTIAYALQQQWPPLCLGCHTCHFSPDITLSLYYGDATELLTNTLRTAIPPVDAWFLDGFSPAKNPEMWTSTLFHSLAALSHPRGTIATFSSAGAVRRGLQAAGFNMEKRKGFAGKREMLTGYRGES